MSLTDLGSLNIFYVLIGAVLLGLFFMVYRSNRRTLDKAAGPRRNVAYECVATPAVKAKPDLLEKFPQLDTLSTKENIDLVRFGIFNWGELALEPEHVIEPIAVTFQEGSQVLSVALGETLKTEAVLPEEPQVDGGRVAFPPFAIAARGTVIFDLMIRGSGKPASVTGAIEGVGPIRRLG